MIVKIIATVIIIAVLAGAILLMTNNTTPDNGIKPPTTPVSQGYVMSFDNSIGYGFEYPETWTMHSPDEFSYTGGILKIDMFTKTPESTSITVIAKKSNWATYNEMTDALRSAYADRIITQKDISIQNNPAFEITLQDSPTKTKMVVVLIKGNVYEFDYMADEGLYDASSAVFDHVVNSFFIDQLLGPIPPK